ncbi:hypothetical protein BaRGS_00010113 [Batillaria attramentaria]|uniref:Uncharacterized protein n=1 Tax=Batillaria attramentaria TaxID=370345 RepID=A0ABD0LHQ5_9CAEN
MCEPTGISVALGKIPPTHSRNSGRVTSHVTSRLTLARIPTVEVESRRPVTAVYSLSAKVGLGASQSFCGSSVAVLGACVFVSVLVVQVGSDCSSRNCALSLCPAFL